MSRRAPAGHTDECACCAFAREQAEQIIRVTVREVLQAVMPGVLHAKLDTLHEQLARLEWKADQIMTATQDIAAADSVLQQLATAAPAIVAALEAAAPSTAQLASDTTTASAALSTILAAVPATAAPTPAPVATAPAAAAHIAQDGPFVAPPAAPPANPFS